MLFIFGVLLEFALVNSYMRRANKYNNLAQNLNWNTIYPPKIYHNDTDDDEPSRHKNGGYCSQPDLVYKAVFFNRRALAVDQISRVAFPGRILRVFSAKKSSTMV
jgi:hypothetical protein